MHMVSGHSNTEIVRSNSIWGMDLFPNFLILYCAATRTLQYSSYS